MFISTKFKKMGGQFIKPLKQAREGIKKKFSKVDIYNKIIKRKLKTLKEFLLK